jgi:hypothetical protein
MQPHSGPSGSKKIGLCPWDHFIQHASLHSTCITSFNPHRFIQSASLHSACITAFIPHHFIQPYHFIQPASLHSACITTQLSSLRQNCINASILHNSIQLALLH